LRYRSIPKLLFPVLICVGIYSVRDVVRIMFPVAVESGTLAKTDRDGIINITIHVSSVRFIVLINLVEKMTGVKNETCSYGKRVTLYGKY